MELNLVVVIKKQRIGVVKLQELSPDQFARHVKLLKWNLLGKIRYIDITMKQS